MVISNIKSETAKDMLRNPATRRASKSVEDDADTVGKSKDCFLVKIYGERFSLDRAIEMERGGTIGAGGKSRERKRARNENLKEMDGAQETGQLGAHNCDTHCFSVEKICPLWR